MRSLVPWLILPALLVASNAHAAGEYRWFGRQAAVVRQSPNADGPVAAGLAALQANRPEQANLILNQALRSDPRNPLLSFLNAFAYEMGSGGAGERQDLARIGYRLALQFDPNFWPAAVQLGNLALAEGNAAEAQGRFARAALIAPQRAEALYGLAAASYATADLLTASAALRRAVAIEPPNTTDRARVAAMVHAATGEPEAAEQMVDWIKLRGDARAAAFTANRVGELNRNYLQRAVYYAGPQAEASSSPDSRLALAAPRRQPPALAPRPANPLLVAQQSHMANIDVVIIQRDESTSSARGVNLLSGLALLFGDNLVNSSYGKTVATNVAGTVAQSVKTFGRGVSLSIPGVAYSLNIANASDGHSQIQARPTLLAYDGQTSKFFNGAEVTYALNGALQAASATKMVGLTLEVTPSFGPEGVVTVKVRTGVSDFYAGPQPGSFEQSLVTTLNNVEVTAAMTYGQTLVIAGGNSTTDSRSASGVPVLRKLPAVQNVFSRKTEQTRETSMIVLLTLRRPSTPQDRWSVDGPFGDADPEALSALQARYEGWFNPPASLASTLGRISREDHGSVFRVGDVRLADPATVSDGMMNGPLRNRFLEDVTTMFYF